MPPPAANRGRLPQARRTESGGVPLNPPYAQLTTLFLDAGNTLVSMDFAWIAREAGSRGLDCSPEDLRRSEARVRPRVSRGIARGGSTEARATFDAWLSWILAGTPAGARLDATELDALGRELTPVLRRPGESDRLWCAVMEGVPEALERFRSLDLQIVVVSNADGTVERGLTNAGLRPLLDVVIDSHLVGFEKPDPGIFRVALERAGAEPARTLHVGDMYHADVVGARGAEVHPLLLDPYGDWETLDCAVARDLGELADRLETARSRSNG